MDWLKRHFAGIRIFGRSDASVLPRDKGAYLVLLRLDAALAGRFAGTDFTLQPGTYAYCGSARGPGGIAARVKRHFRRTKKPHWHIDQLTMAAADLQAMCFSDGDECALVAQLCRAGAICPLPGFGSSDCPTCAAHLLQLPENQEAES